MRASRPAHLSGLTNNSRSEQKNLLGPATGSYLCPNMSANSAKTARRQRGVKLADMFGTMLQTARMATLLLAVLAALAVLIA